MRTFLAVAAIYMVLVGASTTSVDHGSMLTLGNTSYFVSPQVQATLAHDATETFHSALALSDLVPITIVELGNASCDGDTISSVVDSYLAADDVLSTDFLQAIYVKSLAACSNTSVNTLSAYGTKVLVAETSISMPDVPSGPYLLSGSTGALHIPYRLYSDDQEAFVSGIVPAANGAYVDIPVVLNGASTGSIGVPSRLYYQATSDKPLAGVRLGVKDLYSIKGIKTGAGSRAYYATYPPANVTAPAIQKLLDAGAVIVGKMKTTQFAMPEFAPLAIDYQAPFNPRGDGYQDPGSSSSGPGAGLASYDWLDLTIGSDTGGSLRVPADANGLYGNRPTHGLVELTDVVPLAPEFDTAGFLARDPTLWRTAAGVLYANAPDLITNYTTYPSVVQAFGLPDASSNLTTAETLVLSFVDKLASHLSANITATNYTAEWTTTHPSKATDDLDSFLGYTWLALSAKEQINRVRTPFFTDYAALYHGRKPYVNPVAKQYWDWGLTCNQTIEEAVAVKTTFMNWWNSVIMPNDAEACSSSLGIYISTNALGVLGEPTYRYTQSGNLPFVSGTLAGLFVAPFAEVVDVVVPIGQVPYFSEVTGQDEFIPVTVDIMAARGCDLMILDLVKDLASAGVLAAVQTGTSIDGGVTYL